MIDRDDLWKLWFIIGIPAFVILIICNSIYEGKHYKHYYTYVDLDNNEGIAITCQYTDKDRNSKSGGMGSPICKLEDGTIAC